MHSFTRNFYEHATFFLFFRDVIGTSKWKRSASCSSSCSEQCERIIDRLYASSATASSGWSCGFSRYHFHCCCATPTTCRARCHGGKSSVGQYFPTRHNDDMRFPLAQDKLQQLREMGITDETVARQALTAAGGNIERALEIIFGTPLWTLTYDPSSSKATLSRDFRSRIRLRHKGRPRVFFLFFILFQELL